MYSQTFLNGTQIWLQCGNTSSRPKSHFRTLANYQLWMLIAAYVVNLAPTLRDPYRQFRQALTGAPAVQPRYDAASRGIILHLLMSLGSAFRTLQCVTEAISSMQWPTGAMFVKKHFSTEEKRQVSEWRSFRL